MTLTNGVSTVASKRTAYLGPEASFSHQAAVEALPETQPIPLPSFNAILKSLQISGHKSAEKFDFAVLPIENSTNGSVVQALDLLAQCRLDSESSAFPDIQVVDEHYLEVHHYLFVSRIWARQRLTADELDLVESDPEKKPTRKRLEELLAKLNIKTLYTHPQVWGQCNNILSSLLPPGIVDRVDMSSTSAAAAYVATHPSNVQDGEIESGVAAISSSLAGEKHRGSLLCLARDIEDEPGANTTRFLILANQSQNHDALSSGNEQGRQVEIKSLWTFTISHYVPGSLANALAVFAKHGFNLSAIQSRPKPRINGAEMSSNNKFSNWKYVFFVECLHNQTNIVQMHQDKDLDGLLEELRTVTEQLSFLGGWVNRLKADVD